MQYKLQHSTQIFLFKVSAIFFQLNGAPHNDLPAIISPLENPDGFCHLSIFHFYAYFFSRHRYPMCPIA
jgi:hypothetical protein